MFDTVSSDDHYTGHKAAAFGGTTTAMDFVPLALSGEVELAKTKRERERLQIFS
jgi:dihydroorotase-like cyclic amidohydrolase